MCVYVFMSHHRPTRARGCTNSSPVIIFNTFVLLCTYYMMHVYIIHVCSCTHVYVMSLAIILRDCIYNYEYMT